MLGGYFYHEKIRKGVAIFGTLFNNIYVVRKNSSGGIVSQLKVPLAYAPKQKYLDRIRTNPDLEEDQKLAIKLPRMSFEIVSFAYDYSRQLPKVASFNAADLQTSGTVNKRRKFYTPVPYNIGFQLNVYAKSQDDATQIVEQILPTFNPQYTLTIKPFATEYPTWKEDIPIIIQGLALQDDFEGAVEQRRTIIYQLDFEMKLNFYGEIGTSSIIRTATNKFFQMGVGLADSDIHLETMTITPTPVGVSADSDFGFNTVIDLVFDSV